MTFLQTKKGMLMFIIMSILMLIAKLVYNSETKKSIFFQKLGWCYFWGITNCVPNKVKFAIPLNDPEVLSSASDKAKRSAEKFSNNSNLDDSHISLPGFLSRTNLKMHNIPKLVKKVITNLDLSKLAGPDGILVVAIKNWACLNFLAYLVSSSKCV